MAWLRESTARQTFGRGLVRVEAAFEVIVFGVAIGGVESGTHRGCCCPGFRAGLMGRAFSDADGPNSQRVAIVNQTFVLKFFHGASPVGHYVDKDTMIVGVVEDVAIEPGLGPAAPLSLFRTKSPCIFLPRR